MSDGINFTGQIKFCKDMTFILDGKQGKWNVINNRVIQTVFYDKIFMLEFTDKECHEAKIVEPDGLKGRIKLSLREID